MRSEDVDYTDARPVFLPWPKPCEVAREPVRETRPDLRTESEPLAAPIRGSRTTIDGAQPHGRRERIRHGRGVVEGPITGQGNAGMEKVVNEHTLVDHEGIISDEEDVPLRRLAIENALVPDGQEQGQARIHEDEEEEQAEEERHEESDEEGGAHAIEGIMGARRKVKRTLGSDKLGMELYIMWEAKDSSGNNVKNWEPIENVQNPTTVYGECFGGSLKGRFVKCSFKKGTKALLRGESTDAYGGRKVDETYIGVIQAIGESQVKLAFESLEFTMDQSEKWAPTVTMDLLELDEGCSWELHNDVGKGIHLGKRTMTDRRDRRERTYARKS